MKMYKLARNPDSKAFYDYIAVTALNEQNARNLHKDYTVLIGCFGVCGGIFSFDKECVVEFGLNEKLNHERNNL